MISNERLIEIANGAYQSSGLTVSDMAKEILQLRAMLSGEPIGQPVAWLNDAYLARGVVEGEVGVEDQGPGYIPVYRHPQNGTPIAD